MANENFDDEFDLIDDEDSSIEEGEFSQQGQDYSQPTSYSNDDVEYASDETSNLVVNLLKERGINDPNSIKFEGDDGIVRSKSWNDLTAEEQKNILNNAPDADPDADLDNEEIDFINRVRQSGLSMNQFLEQVSDTIQQQPAPEPSYKVDELTDDELYILDLETKVGDLSEEDAANALATAKQNSSLFQKQMNGIREEYRNLEQESENRKEQEYVNQQQEAFNEFAYNVGDSINSLTNIGSLDIALADEDKEELADFILGRDQTGVSYFGRALNDPETLVQMAWFALHGQDTLNEINNYMSQEIRKAAQAGYNKGVAEARNGSRVVISRNANTRPQFYNTNNNRGTSSIDDLD